MVVPVIPSSCVSSSWAHTVPDWGQSRGAGSTKDQVLWTAHLEAEAVQWAVESSDEAATHTTTAAREATRRPEGVGPSLGPGPCVTLVIFFLCFFFLGGFISTSLRPSGLPVTPRTCRVGAT